MTMGDKRSNNTRETTPTVISIRRAISNYYKKLASGEYDKDKSFINIENGGYLLYAKYRTMDNMEYNAATFMAMKGYPMIMTPEGKEGYELMIDAKGHSRYGDGRIGLTIHSASYEQRSPKATSEATARVTVENGVNHARKKNASITAARSQELT